MGKIINLSDFRPRQIEALKSVNVDLSTYLSYKSQIKDYINSIAKTNLKEKNNTNEQFDLLKQFYEAYFNVSDEIAEQVLDGDNKNLDILNNLISQLDNIRRKKLPLHNMEYLKDLDRNDLERLRNRNMDKKSDEYTIDDYIDFMDEIDEYINDLTSYSTSKTIEFAKSEQLYIITSLYVAFENIGEDIIKEIIDGEYKNVEALSLIIREYENIWEEIPNVVSISTLKKLSYHPDKK